jgi:hypothetical protein
LPAVKPKLFDERIVEGREKGLDPPDFAVGYSGVVFPSQTCLEQHAHLGELFIFRCRDLSRLVDAIVVMDQTSSALTNVLRSETGKSSRPRGGGSCSSAPGAQ